MWTAYWAAFVESNMVHKQISCLKRKGVVYETF